MNRKFKLIFLLLGLFFLTGCSFEIYKVDNPLNEDEIITYVQEQIYEETGDDVIVKIKLKEKLRTCTFWFDTCLHYQNVIKGHTYTLDIINKNNTSIVATGTYEDGYIKYGDNEATRKAYFESNYKSEKILYLAKNEFITALKLKFDKYYIYKDVGNYEGFDIFITSSNYDDINELLNSFKNTIIKYEDDVNISFSVYIYKDNNIFNNTNFNLYKNCKQSHSGQSNGKDMIEQYTGKKVTRIGNTYGFNYELFTSNGASASKTNKEYKDYTTFEYLVFWYSSNPNCLIKYDSSTFQIFGIK